VRRLALLALALPITACSVDVPGQCAAAVGASATCQAACDNLADIDCQPAPSTEECVATCEAAGTGVAAAERDRALACYAAAKSCGDVEGCSRHCGPSGGSVPWTVLDAGNVLPDAGADAAADGG